MYTLKAAPLPKPLSVLLLTHSMLERQHIASRYTEPGVQKQIL